MSEDRLYDFYRNGVLVEAGMSYRTARFIYGSDEVKGWTHVPLQGPFSTEPRQ